MTIYIITNGTCSRCRQLNGMLERRGFSTKFIHLDNIDLPAGKSKMLPIVKVNQKLFYWVDYKSLDIIQDTVCDYLDTLVNNPIDEDEKVVTKTDPVLPIKEEPKEETTAIDKDCGTECEIPTQEIPFPVVDTRSYSDKVWDYFIAHVRYAFGSEWVHDQAEWRLSKIEEHSPICAANKECHLCGCPVGIDKASLEYGDSPCDGGCFPSWMNKKEWIKFKVNAGI